MAAIRFRHFHTRWLGPVRRVYAHAVIGAISALCFGWSGATKREELRESLVTDGYECPRLRAAAERKACDTRFPWIIRVSGHLSSCHRDRAVMMYPAVPTIRDYD